MDRLGTSDVPSQAQCARKFLSARTGVKLGYGMYRAEERAGPEDVGEQALMRGLDTAFPFFVWGCPGLRSGVDQMIGHTGSLGNSPAVVPPSLLHD
jgi:hypothetical protein